MAKLIIVNITFMDLWDMTLLCMTIWTLRRRSTISGVRKLKVLKANEYKNMVDCQNTFSHILSLYLTQLLGLNMKYYHCWFIAFFRGMMFTLFNLTLWQKTGFPFQDFSCIECDKLSYTTNIIYLSHTISLLPL